MMEGHKPSFSTIQSKRYKNQKPFLIERSLVKYLGKTEIIWLALHIRPYFFMLHSLAKLKLQTNFDAISKTVKNLEIGPVDPKLWKFCEITRLKRKKRKKKLAQLGFEPATTDYWTDALDHSASLVDIWKHEKIAR